MNASVASPAMNPGTSSTGSAGSRAVRPVYGVACRVRRA